MDWIKCNKERLVKDVKIDKNLIKSLIKSSDKKSNTQKLISLNNDTATSKISLCYEALRELLEALAISKGYKIYNHECYSAFLKEILNKSELANKFDKFRKIRNDINYYGKDITSNEAKEILAGMNSIISKIKSKIL